MQAPNPLTKLQRHAYGDCFKWSYITDPAAGFVSEDGSLTIEVDVCVYDTPVSINGPEIQLPPSTMSEDLAKLLASGNFTDVEIRCSTPSSLSDTHPNLQAQAETPPNLTSSPSTTSPTENRSSDDDRSVLPPPLASPPASSSVPVSVMAHKSILGEGVRVSKNELVIT